MLLAIVAELIFFGGGRLIDIGPVTFRMIFFALAQIYVVCAIFKSKIKPYVMGLVLYFVCSLTFSAVMGLSNNADSELVVTDMKSISYFVMLIFFYITIKNRQTIISVSNTIKTCSFVVATAYLCILIAIFLGYIDYGKLWQLLGSSDEFIISEGRFFYKGFLYLCIGFVFFSVESSKKLKVVSILFLVGIIFTFTRGLMLSTAAVYLLYITVFTPLKMKKFIVLSLSMLILVLLASWYIENLGDRGDSNNQRIIALKQVKEALTPLSLLFGHGLGIGVEEKPEHMEITYVEIFHKQGAVGLFLWVTVFVSIIYRYIRIDNKGDRLIALPYVLSTILIYIQTSTNPFLNNPIGMGMVLISLVVVTVLSNHETVETQMAPIIKSGESAII